MLRKLSGYSYSCVVSELGSKSSEGATSSGEEIGSGEGYGSASTSPKFYYQVDANGAGPNSSTKHIISVVSVVY